MEKKKKLIILGVILLLIIVSGATFAILTWNSTMIKLGINTNCFTIDYTRGGDITGSLKLINEEDLISNGKFTIKEGVGVSGVNIGINSNCSIEGFGSIYLNVTNISDVFTTGDSKGALKYVVLKNTSTITNPTNINITSLLNQSFDIESKGSITSSDTITLLIKQLSNTEVNKYIVVIYIDNNLAGNDVTEAIFKGNISVEANQGKIVPVTPSYCFDITKNSTNMTASLASNGYKCYDGNEYGYETIEEINIPSNIDGYTITEIGAGAFCNDYKYVGGLSAAACMENGKSLVGVTIPDSVTRIGAWAFYATGLTYVNFGENVKYIDGAAFMTNKLTSIVLPKSIISISSNIYSSNSGYTMGAFGSNQLTNIVIPDSLTEIGNYAFDGNNLNYVYIGSDSNLTSIGSSAFSSSTNSNPNLKKIYYNGSNSLPWIYAVNGSDSSTKFVTGTVPSYTNSSGTIYNEVLITTGK